MGSKLEIMTSFSKINSFKTSKNLKSPKRCFICQTDRTIFDVLCSFPLSDSSPLILFFLSDRSYERPDFPLIFFYLVAFILLYSV